ncbi:MAG: hydrogenase formation protein HypD [Zestosphaera tikiterensis]|uniref:Hydrogenase formation protein HypD n=1 Tax=Zestosphaera tikiterensis TaxID=1973259 RepID=A0A2R7Y8M8_9CREN|nr:MAG: hydrogenase formation protein HypD [Zestosphaera tikiterensis]
MRECSLSDLRLRIKELYERNPKASEIVKIIRDYASIIKKHVKIMDFCGTHEWTITYYGLRSLMPNNIELIAGPGCPVCVTPGYYVEALIKLSLEGVNVITYGDAFKLPSVRGSNPKSLAEAKALGGKVTVVYSFLDAVKVAKERPNEEHVFFSVGFETTMPAVSTTLYYRAVPHNLYVLSAHRLTPPIMKYLMSNVKGVELDGVLAPGHVSAILGSNAWEFIPKDYGVTTVVTGFEPLDVLLAVLLILKSIKEGRAELLNEYRRVVKPEGNLTAKKTINEVFTYVDSYWRGIGVVEGSGAKLKATYERNDAEVRYGIKEPKTHSDIIPGCRCGEVVLGLRKPTECPLFMKVCTPENPYGPCMVSSEGTCRIWAENLPLSVEGI